ncbi:MAG: hypothetical protein AAGF95_09120 [Chloroflexota bacterium]
MFTRLSISYMSIGRRFALVGLIFALLSSVLLPPLPVSAATTTTIRCNGGDVSGYESGSECDYYMQNYDCTHSGVPYNNPIDTLTCDEHIPPDGPGVVTIRCDGGDVSGYTPGSECDYYMQNYDCTHSGVPYNNPIDTLTCNGDEGPGDEGPGDKDNDPPERCRNFEETWTQEYEILLNGGGQYTRIKDFSEARVWVRACYNSKYVYIEGYETNYRLFDDPQGRGFRPLPQHYETTLTPNGTGENNASTSSVRVRFQPHFSMPNQGISFITASIMAFGGGAGFRANDAEVRYVNYAINIDPHGCYIHTGGGSEKQCPHGKYGGNN